MKKSSNKSLLGGMVAFVIIGLAFCTFGLLLPSCEKAFELHYKPTANDVQIVSDPARKDSLKKDYSFPIKIVLNNFKEGNDYGYKVSFELVNGLGEFFVNNNQYFEPVKLVAKETACYFLSSQDGGKVSFVITVTDALNNEVVTKKQFTLNAFNNKTPIPSASIKVNYFNPNGCLFCNFNSTCYGLTVSVTDTSKDEDQAWGGSIGAIYVRFSILANNIEIWSNWYECNVGNKKDIPIGNSCKINQIQLRAVDNQGLDKVVATSFSESGL